MSRVKPNDRSLSRHLHHFLEPEAVAVQAIKNVIVEILRNGPHGDLETECAPVVQKFADDAGLDIYSAMLDSKEPSVQRIGLRQLHLAAAWASHTTFKLNTACRTYINVPITGLTPGKLKELIADFIVTREELAGDLPTFLGWTDNEKALEHLERLNRLCVQLTAFAVQEALLDLAPSRERRHIPKNMLNQTVMEALSNGRVPFDIATHPKLIGIACAHYHKEMAIARQNLILEGGTTPETLADRLADIKAVFMYQFNQPQHPREFALQEPRFSSNLFDRLDVTGSGH